MSATDTRAAAALAAAALLVACSSTRSAPRADPPREAAPAPSDPRSTEPPMDKTAPPTPTFEPAHALAPADELRAWLDGLDTATLVRLPVELSVSVLGVTGAVVGFGADPLAIDVDDSALGESLADRASQFCGDAETCAMWVWGHWRAGTLRVVRAEGAIAAGDRAAASQAFVAR